MNDVPDLRIRRLGAGDLQTEGHYVLYWMTAFRRTQWNFSLQRAVWWAEQLKKPLVVLEALRCGYRWASDRLHAFVIQGMADNAQRLARKSTLYYPYLESEPGGGQGLLQHLAQSACIVVGDDFPCFFLPRMLAAAQRQIPTALELVDSNGILPMRATDKVFLRAHDFRRFLQKNLHEHLELLPEDDPLAGVRLKRISMDQLPGDPQEQWPVADVSALVRSGDLSAFPIDHAVGPGVQAGGSRAAEKALRGFLESKLDRYTEERNQPDDETTSRLSPYLHFGHLSAHQVFAEMTALDGWSPAQLAEKANGSAQGWWGASEAVEAFLDQLITWRELGFNMCWQRPDYTRYSSLPDWARKTLAEHAADPRPWLYSLQQFEAAETHDPLWNAAQRQLVREGRMHNYLRMLWGKKILHWSESPEEALRVMIELNNKYAVDGRDPNSYSGVFWCLGRYDRAWGPERPIFGKIRYMTSESTARKLRVKQYLERYA